MRSPTRTVWEDAEVAKWNGDELVRGVLQVLQSVVAPSPPLSCQPCNHALQRIDWPEECNAFWIIQDANGKIRNRQFGNIETKLAP